MLSLFINKTNLINDLIKDGKIDLPYLTDFIQLTSTSSATSHDSAEWVVLMTCPQSSLYCRILHASKWSCNCKPSAQQPGLTIWHLQPYLLVSHTKSLWKLAKKIISCSYEFFFWGMSQETHNQHHTSACNTPVPTFHSTHIQPLT